MHSYVCGFITYHVSLRGLYRGVDGVGAAVGQVLAHPLLHVSQQFLPTATGVIGHMDSQSKTERLWS